MILRVVSPLQGWVGPLAELPDPAFAEGMVGDGVAIDPVGSILHAPCAGTIVGIHRAGHAITIRSDGGVEILCHIGIDTVELGGTGFSAQVVTGDHVDAGDPLVHFDLDTLARGATSLASPILVIDTHTFRVTRRTTGTRIAVGDWLMDIDATGAAKVHFQALQGSGERTRAVTLPAGHGIHARPAAAIVACARGFDANVELIGPLKRASVRSAVALMTLGLVGGDRATLSAEGPQADMALDALAWLIENGLEGGPTPQVPTQSADRSTSGVTAVPGVAVGTIVRFDDNRCEPPELGQGIASETRSLDQAIETVLGALGERMAHGPSAQRAIAKAHRMLLDDARLRDAAASAIAAGASAGKAWRLAVAPDIAALRSVADPRIAARADDLVDLERQVIAATLGLRQSHAQLPKEAILVAHDLLPSELMTLDASRLAGVALAAGGPTSHVAIIAAALGLPMVVALGSKALAIEAGTRAVLDADVGTLVVADVAAEAAARTAMTVLQARRAAAQAQAQTPCSMVDGTRIEVFANLGSLADADAAMTAGAEGCGLLRTELLFLDRETPPNEDEQFALYSAIAHRLDDRPLIIRTLDIGGDKPVAYLPMASEENPALGLRGIRVGLARPDLLTTQLRAIMRVTPERRCRILLPMIASLDELVEVRQLADAAARAICRSGPVEIGVMIETPAAAITADLLAPAADFFAIGTNDLAQYTLAMDRGNAAVAARVDALHPAVLRMIDCAARAAATHGRPVGVCGGLASDLGAAAILIGLGVTELSAVPGIVPELKALVRLLTMADCAALAREALGQTSAGAVRALASRGRA
ncbi:MAG: phosphoenolpyruvate--protein phosphotransferase [Pseudomonadota bacterium]|nr:phosphoenolpyruvate--protein phosphotransferase [Pseudomonadota bacterium]